MTTSRPIIIAIDFLNPKVSDEQLSVFFRLLDLAETYAIPFFGSNKEEFHPNGRKRESVVYDEAVLEWLVEKTLVYLVAPNPSAMLPSIKDIELMGCPIVVIIDPLLDEPLVEARLEQVGSDLSFLTVSDLAALLAADAQ